MSRWPSLSDEELIHRLKANITPALLSELVERHQVSIAQQCQHYIKDQEEAQDVTQEVFLRVLLKLSSFTEKAIFAPWLHHIVHSRCVDHIRQNKALLHLETAQHIAKSWPEHRHANVTEKQTVKALEELMNQISGEDKYLLLLKYREHWSVRQIQQLTKLSEITIKNKLYLANQNLQKILNETLPS